MSSNIRLQKTCQFCGEHFIAKTTVTQCCSDDCAKKAYKAKKRNEKIEVVIKQETEKAISDLTLSQKNFLLLVKSAS